MTKKEIILRAGAKLFAKRTYDSVGIRDIADEAGVNSAMISYYFGGKVGLLREIFTRFSRRLAHESAQALTLAESQDDLLGLFVEGVLEDARQNRDVYLVGLKEMNHDSEELQDLRDEFYVTAEATFLENINRLGISVPDNSALRFLGFTAALGLIFSDYLLGGGGCMNDPTLQGPYKETVIKILRTGMTGYWN